MILQRLFSRKTISKLIKKNKDLDWEEKERISEALEGVAYRQKRREAYRTSGVNNAKENIIGSSSGSSRKSDPAQDRAEELARKNSQSRAEEELLTKRYKKLTRKRKTYSILGTAIAGPAGSDKFQERKAVANGVVKQDWKDGNYLQAVKHSFGMSKSTAESFKNGQYGGQANNS